MKLLLDTHVAVWAVLNDPKLGGAARRLIDDADELIVSTATIWEIAIKHALLGKRRDSMVLSGHAAQDQFEAAGFTLLPITAAHAAAVDDLPPLHGDPFDRLLVAQALTEPLRLLTRDARLADYGALVTVV